MRIVRVEFSSYEDFYDFEFIAPDDVTEEKFINDLAEAIVKSIKWEELKRSEKLMGKLIEYDEFGLDLIDCIDFKNVYKEMEKRGYKPLKYDIIVYAGAWTYINPKTLKITDFHNTGELTKLEKAIQEKLQKLRKSGLY
jgi:tRNA A37 threonylcarbamoyladenosine dehydratase